MKTYGQIDTGENRGGKYYPLLFDGVARIISALSLMSDEDSEFFWRRIIYILSARELRWELSGAKQKR